MAVIFYDRDGAPLAVLEWARLYEDDSYRRVRGSLVTSGADPSQTFLVSTIWEGIDSSFGYVPGVPMIFETRVLTECDSDLAGHCVRRPSLATAESAHDDVVAMVAAALDDPIVTALSAPEHDVPATCDQHLPWCATTECRCEPDGRGAP